MSMAGRELESDETMRLISADKVAGTSVYGADRKKIGSIDKIMVDKHSGRVSFAVMSFGGFLGIGEKLHPLPWNSLRYDEELDGYVVGLTKDALDKAPSYDAGREPDWADPGYREGVRGYWGGTPPIV
ncbi:MAG: PRC-barrel domain-containing protein [Rubrimonas sp.]